MVNQTLEYVKSCSLKAKKLQHLSEHLVTNGPEGTVSSKCFKSLELLKKSLLKMEGNIKELSTYPGFNIQLNLEALLTLHVENQHAVTHFKRDTFSLYEYALIFGSSVKEAVKRMSKWAAAYYTHPASYYKSLVLSCLMFLCLTDLPCFLAHGRIKSSSSCYKLKLQLVTSGVQPDIIESLDNEVREEHTTEQPEPIDTYSESDSDTVSGDENEHAHQTVISVMQPTGLGRTRRLTQRMIDYLQS